ncbi:MULTISPECIES: zinc-binding dehydrogenase [Cupriavidus]|uniref:Zinc-containing alcohol dehydrogenase superfamily n=1 Tax=Cupriavidus pinatubonensis (strain JMP 134 / LMG 1197) TaxID=264198 RepID=Q46NP1_CUPPJ|nr:MULTISPECIES: zinc-binding dehydrogenase [Cupriavidus]TPQ38351.1 alcohol dehydrogenase [Cupriavidus pinatubonensis]
MKAVVIVKRAGQERPDLEYQTVPDPKPEPNELLVSVRAAGINRIDLHRSTAHGAPAAGKPLVAGLEMSGEVVAVGENVHDFRTGDKVYGMTTGSYAELATIDHRYALPVPPAFSFDQATAVATVYPTAHNALVTNGQFAAGKTVLIQGVSSAVGIATLQIAKAMGAKCVVGTGRPNANIGKLAEAGLDRFLLNGTDNIPAEIMAMTDGRGVDTIVDMVGGPTIADNLESVALAGRIVSVGWVGGTKGEIDLDTLARKRVTLVGVSFRTRTVEEKTELFAQFRRDVYPLFVNGTLVPYIAATYHLSEAAAAQDAMAEDKHFGKILLHP